MMDLVRIVLELPCVQDTWICIHVTVYPVLVDYILAADVKNALVRIDVDDDMVEQYQM
jgi:hypothetical protein